MPFSGLGVPIFNMGKTTIGITKNLTIKVLKIN